MTINLSDLLGKIAKIVAIVGAVLAALQQATKAD